MRTWFRRLIQWLTIWVMAFAVLPFSGTTSVFASTPSYNSTIYFTFDSNGSSPSSPSTTPLNPSQINTNLFTVTGTYNNVTATSLKLVINQIVVNQSGAITVENSTTPSISPATTGTTQGTFNFSNVPLYPGINQIVITGALPDGTAVQTSTNPASNGVDPSNTDNPSYYVNYINSPSLQNFQINNTSFGSVAYINDTSASPSHSFSFSMQGNNTTSISVTSDLAPNGIPANPVSGTTQPVTYYALNIPLQFGLNNIVITASNGSSTITYNKQVYYYSEQFPLNVHFNGDGANFSYNVSSGQTPVVVSPTTPNAKIAAQLYDGDNITSTTQYPTATMDVVDVTNNSTNILHDPSVGVTFASAANSTTSVYNLLSSQNMPSLTAGHTYNVSFNVTPPASPVGVPGVQATYTYSFVYEPAGQVYYGGAYKWNHTQALSDTYSSVSVPPSSITAIASGASDNILTFDNGAMASYALQFNNLANTAGTPTVTVDGNTLGTNYYNWEYGVDGSNPSNSNLNYMTIQLKQDATTGTNPVTPGIHTVTVSIPGTPTGTVTGTFQINFLGTPLIQVQNIYNGEIFSSSTLPEIDVKFFNMNPSDISSTTVAIGPQNAQTAISWSSFTNIGGNIYQYKGPSSSGISLSPGQNVLTLANQTDGIQVQLTLLNLANPTESVNISNPMQGTQGDQILNRLPVLSGQPDPNTQAGTTPGTYITNGKYIIFKAGFLNLSSSFDIQVNNKSILPFAMTSTYWSKTALNLLYPPVNGVSAFPVPNDSSHDPSYQKDGDSFVWIDPNSSPSSPIVYVALDISNLSASTGSNNSLTIKFVPDGNTSSAPFVVIEREMQSYNILQPVNGVSDNVNQNFYTVEIEPTGVNFSSVTIGKTTITSGPNAFASNGSGVADYQITVPLKAGVNSVPYVIQIGSQSFKGKLTITNQNQNTLGAQDLTPMTKSGGLSAFNGAVSIKFPQNTAFSTNNMSGDLQQQELHPDPSLSTTQSVLFGIADPNSGAVSFSSTGVPNYDITGQSDIQMLHNLGYNFVDNLYWIDPGYQVSGPSATGDPVFNNGIQPFAPNYQFYNRYTWGKELFPTHDGTLTISYDPALRNNTGTILSIMHYSPPTGWVNLGGVTNQNSHSVSVPFNEPGFYAVVYLRHAYQDITNSSWARNYLNAMVAKGVMLPTQPGSQFGTAQYMTRAEWAEVMVKALGLDLVYNSASPTFFDVPQTPPISGSLWDYRYVETAARDGIVNGIGDGAFDPNGNITREDTAVMIAHALNLKLPGDSNAQYAQTLAALQKLYTDAASIDRYSAGAVLVVSKLGLLDGYPNIVTSGGKQTYYFSPGSNLTREEGSAIAYRTMQQLGKLPK